MNFYSIEAKLERTETKIMQLEKEVIKARHQSDLWRRISNRLYEAFTEPDATDEDRADAIETYLNYATPDDDE